MAFEVSTSLAFATLVVALVCLFSISKLHKHNAHPYPPGPPGEFLIGHLRVIPFEDSPTAYRNWGKQYKSDVLYFNTLRQPIVVLNSVRACIDLLDKRGANYADRPRFVLLELLGWGMTLTWLRWGPKMQQHRRVLQSPFTKSKTSVYQPLQLFETHRALKSFISQPDHWDTELKRYAMAIVSYVAYGIDVDTIKHPWVKLQDDAEYATSHGGAPGSTLVDRFPPVQYLPDWLPGLHSVKYAHDNRFAITNVHEIPFQYAMKEMDEGTNKSSFIHDLLEKYRSNERVGVPNEFTLADIKGAAGAIIIAGSTTTFTTLLVFVLMMMSYPSVQRKAQAEIDALIGHDRLPTFQDIDKLPYLNLMLQELLRIAPTSPLGIPHRNLEDDVYNGMLIPKGSIIYQNMMAMHRDPEFYSDAEAFIPERYLAVSEGGLGEPYPNGNFGFGRRICPGQFLANNTILIAMASMLATLDIDWPIGPSGKPEPFTPKFSKVGQYHPLKFGASITPRSKKAEELAMSTDTRVHPS